MDNVALEINMKDSHKLCMKPLTRDESQCNERLYSARFKMDSKAEETRQVLWETKATMSPPYITG